MKTERVFVAWVARQEDKEEQQQSCLARRGHLPGLGAAPALAPASAPEPGAAPGDESCPQCFLSRCRSERWRPPVLISPRPRCQLSPLHPAPMSQRARCDVPELSVTLCHPGDTWWDPDLSQHPGRQDRLEPACSHIPHHVHEGSGDQGQYGDRYGDSSQGQPRVHGKGLGPISGFLCSCLF